MQELDAAEQVPAPGFTLRDGSVATLFSSNNARTVLRHFEWMSAWGLDGVAVQRFAVALGDVSQDHVLNLAQSAAERTGRVFYVMYDLTGMQQSDIVAALTSDWAKICPSLLRSPSYVTQNGKAVVGVYGFFISRFSAATANAILDVFLKGSEACAPAFLAASGEW